MVDYFLLKPNDWLVPASETKQKSFMTDGMHARNCRMHILGTKGPSLPGSAQKTGKKSFQAKTARKSRSCEQKRLVRILRSS
jgi:hypothetical protein